MKWQVHGRRPVYESPWVGLWLDDVELPDGRRFEHHVVRVPNEAVSVAVVNSADEVLMLWRHRFIVDAWQWELPSGWVEPGEAPEDAARREVEEETGWRVGGLEPIGACNADNGLVALRSRLYLGTDVTYQGPPQDITEAARVAWVPLTDVHTLIRDGLIQDAPVLVALLLTLAAHSPGGTPPPNTRAE